PSSTQSSRGSYARFRHHQRSRYGERPTHARPICTGAFRGRAQGGARSDRMGVSIQPSASGISMSVRRYSTPTPLPLDPDNAVSEPEIRAFSGSLGPAKANKGVFVTTSYFTNPAKDFAERHPFKIVLIDG